MHVYAALLALALPFAPAPPSPVVVDECGTLEDALVIPADTGDYTYDVEALIADPTGQRLWEVTATATDGTTVHWSLNASPAQCEPMDPGDGQVPATPAPAASPVSADPSFAG